VTSAKRDTTAAGRKRRQRQREHDQALYFERQDWQLFLPLQS
jgi:hypothetical protein